MPLDRERKIGARHAGAVVGDANEPPPAAVGHDLDTRRTGIERVLDQLLDRARRPLDHFAGGDAVDDGLGELTHGHGTSLIRNPASLAAHRAPRESPRPGMGLLIATGPPRPGRGDARATQRVARSRARTSRTVAHEVRCHRLQTITIWAIQIGTRFAPLWARPGARESM